MRRIDLTLYLITRSGEALIKMVHEAIKGGVTAVQLRDKESSVHEMITLAQGLKEMLKPLGIPLLINDRVDVALAVGADGVHLGQSDLSVKEARAILGNEAFIGLSTGTREEVMAAENEDVDYLGVGPVFHTESKVYQGKPCGLEGLKELCALSRRPVVAVGGMNEINARKALERGAAGIAVVSTIFNAPCPKTAARSLINRMKK